MKTYLNNVMIFFLFLLLSSCSFLPLEHNKFVKIKNSNISYELNDQSGNFIVEREIFNNDTVTTILSIYPSPSQEIMNNINDKDNNILERRTTTSYKMILNKKNNLSILGPKNSEYITYINKQKYYNKMVIDYKKKVVKVKLQGPQERWNGVESFDFPSDLKIMCFFNQVVECIKQTGFIKKAIKNNAGEMNFYLLWDGFPYHHEQLTNVPYGLFNKVSLKYDGKTKNNLLRLSLEVSGQIIHYLLNNSGELDKIFWITQNISMIAGLKK